MTLNKYDKMNNAIYREKRERERDRLLIVHHLDMKCRHLKKNTNALRTIYDLSVKI